MTAGQKAGTRQWVCRILRLAVGGLFLWAGAVKIIDPETFAVSIQGYRLVPDAVAAGLAWFLPWLEVWCALALWRPAVLRRSAWILITLMLVVFTAAKVSAVMRGLDISCGCTTSTTPLNWWSVAGNVGWLVVSVSGFLLEGASRPGG
jgi:uncharacterized membrane protein YphA (DoxX/SURF4 family)